MSTHHAECHDVSEVKSPSKALGFLSARCAMPKRGAPADTTNHWLCDGDQC